MYSNKEPKTEQVLVLFPKTLRDALYAKSDELGSPVSEIIRRAVAQKLNESTQ